MTGTEELGRAYCTAIFFTLCEQQNGLSHFVSMPQKSPDDASICYGFTQQVGSSITYGF
jgi:hypothetical protein